MSMIHGAREAVPVGACAVTACLCAVVVGPVAQDSDSLEAPAAPDILIHIAGGEFTVGHRH